MAVRAGRGRRRTAAVVCFLTAAAALLCACGGPEFTYVTNSADRTYLKVPTSWRPIDNSSEGDAPSRVR